MSADALLALAIAAALALDAFVTHGGVDLGPNTGAEIVVTVLGAALCVAAILFAPGGRLWGASSLLLLSALAALTLASISWSVEPAASWVEANRTLSYLAAFAGALALARLAPGRWPALVGAIALLATGVSAYALLVKVFPATLDPSEILGRLRAPFDYWNAVGLMAALGLPACLWAGARRGAGRGTRALAAPALGVLLVALVLCYSRGGLLVAAIGSTLWFALVPLRLRAAAVLAAGAAGAAVVIVWALATHPITRDHASLSSRAAAGRSFGLLLLMMLALLGLVGYATASAIDRVDLPRKLRRRIGIVLVSLVACVPIAVVGALAASPHGLPGEVSHIWHTVTNPHTSGVGDDPARLAQVSNSRARYWREGLRVGEHAPIIGAGALGYATARTRYSTDALVSQHAHSYVVETFADFGLIGLGISLALLIAWSIAAGRAVGAGRPRALTWIPRRRSASAYSAPLERAAELAAERAGLLTMVVIVGVFALHSAIDWTWFIPGVAMPALICAGWLAGRGPLAGASAPTRGSGVSESAPARDPLRLAAVAAIAALALICAWTIWQPLRSEHADQAALAALAGGKDKLALTQARAALARDPFSAEARSDLAAVYGAIGAPRAAHDALVRAVALQPANPATWLALGEYDLQSGDPREALSVLQAALYLGPYEPEAQSAVAQARSALSAARRPRAVTRRSRPAGRAPQQARAQRRAVASSVRRRSGARPAARTRTSAKPNPVSTDASERRV